MPKATSNLQVHSSAPPLGGRPALRRNQACRQCRKRKLKCDASRPHCGTCVKQWQALISVPAPSGYSHPAEPQCSYDPVEGLALAPDADPMERIRALEEQISQLKGKLSDSPQLSSRSASPAGSTRHVYRSSPSNFSGGIALPASSLDLRDHSGDYRGTMAPELPNMGKISPEPFLHLLYSGWNTDLPDPQVMLHLVEVFFRCDPCGSRVLHRPSFMASLQLHPKDPGFPHVAILHAISASASRWASHDIVTSAEGIRRDPFAEYHASKTRQYIDRTMATGIDIFPVLQACILLSWYFYTDGRWVEVWVFAGFQTRVAIPLRLNYPGTFTVQSRNAPGAYLAPPRDVRELELRRRTWWMTVMFDRIVSMGGWVHGIDERDIGTELPLRTDDFHAERQMPGNPQDIITKDLYVTHMTAYTDSFILFLKTMMLFGKVTDYNVRTNLRSTNAPNSSQSPFYLEGFEALDRLVHDFYENLPVIYKSSYGLGDSPDGDSLDTDLYMVHVAPHAAMITLHTHFINFNDPNSVSTTRCLNSAQAILSAYYMLSATSLDLTRLHPFVTICWYLAAVVQIHVCKHCIETGDLEREASVWSEINILRFAMLEYGNRCPIGTRQEKLLQGLMAEIIQMTSQKQPLQVGVPLYPWSHATAFAQGQGSSSDGSSPAHVAPLPVNSEFENTGSTTAAMTPSPPAASTAWTAHGSAHMPAIIDRQSMYR